MNPLQYITRAILINEFTAGHWQNKLYPYGGTGQTLGDGIMRSIDLPVDYWWCWLAIGVSIAYILLLNAIIVILLTVLPGMFRVPRYHLLCMLPTSYKVPR